MMRVLHVIAPAPYGGLERVVESLAVAQHWRGHEVDVAAIIEANVPEPPILDFLRRGGVRVTVIARPPRAYAAQRHALRAAIRATRPDVIHSHGYVADVIVASAASFGNARLVSTVHGFTGGGFRNRVYERLQRLAYHRFGAVVAVSRKLAGELVRSGIAERRVHTVANACPALAPPLGHAAARAELGVANGVFSIGWIGRVSREKGLDVLIEALPALAGLPWHLTVLGDGRERVTLERRVEQLALVPRVNWRGSVADAAALIRGFDVLVISSRTEGTPMALFEAMHGEVPVVTTAVGGIPDVVSPGEALLVPSEDPASLAEAIRACHDLPVRAAERVQRARARLAAEFSIDEWVDRYDRVYGA